MYGPAGHAYVYFNYGVHWMLNVTAHAHGDPAAVLIRAAEPLAGLDIFRMHRAKALLDRAILSGPGKLAAAFEVTGGDNGKNLFDTLGLHFEPGERPKKVLAGPRIGIRHGTEHLWRFVDASRLEWVSRPLGRLTDVFPEG